LKRFSHLGAVIDLEATALDAAFAPVPLATTAGKTAVALTGDG
jgi:hypothetical protein